METDKSTNEDKRRPQGRWQANERRRTETNEDARPAGEAHRVESKARERLVSQLSRDGWVRIDEPSIEQRAAHLVVALLELLHPERC